MTRRALFAVLTVVLSLGAVWCVLWVFSSASLGCTACDCTYSLFHEIPRCRHPLYALIGVVVTGLAAIVCLVLAVRSRPNRANNAT
jgi:hypothetical protein